MSNGIDAKCSLYKKKVATKQLSIMIYLMCCITSATFLTFNKPSIQNSSKDVLSEHSVKQLAIQNIRMKKNFFTKISTIPQK